MELVELYRRRLNIKGHAFAPDTPWQAELESAFAYTETVDQLHAVDDVKQDMEAEVPMDRLVCGDVGFGKTEVAVRAVFKAIQDGKQAAVLVPTTLLAQQHTQTFTERFAGFPVRVEMLSRFLTTAEARQVVAGLAAGSVDVVIGTHRMLAADVSFKDLGLLVVDEEQRFGVSHKESIKQMTVGVDVLTLTANPIPRTLEMALTGIRDLSLINTPPAARQPILTYVGEFEEAAVVEALRRELLREGQVFFVHNWVQNIEAVAARLRTLVPEARVAVAHGQMDEGTLEQVVLDFWERRFDVLVCTTIIESGIDMPTVNTLVVDRADRLGLGQLHQLRGRVGRAGQRAYAYLLHPADRVLSETAYERLRTIGEQTEFGAGFKIAMRDLEIRGAGNLLGRDQSGHIAAVGYDLYVQLVAEAVAEMKGEPLRSRGRDHDRRPLRRPSPRRLRGARGPAARGVPAPGGGGRRRRGATTSSRSGSTASGRCPPPPRGCSPWRACGCSACGRGCARCRRPRRGPGREVVPPAGAPWSPAWHRSTCRRRPGCGCAGCGPRRSSRRTRTSWWCPSCPGRPPWRPSPPSSSSSSPRRGAARQPNRRETGPPVECPFREARPGTGRRGRAVRRRRGVQRLSSAGQRRRHGDQPIRAPGPTDPGDGPGRAMRPHRAGGGGGADAAGRHR